MIEISKDKPVIWLYASDESWIEGDALRQLRQTAELDRMIVAVGLPDLHPGRGNPVGAAFLMDGVIYPYLIGNDVGCGMGLWQTSLKANNAKRDKWVKKLDGLEHPWSGDLQDWLSGYGLCSTDYDSAHGTIGGGNHFAELQRIDRIHCEETSKALGLDKNCLYLMVHSGSRGMGESLLRRHTDRFKAGGLIDDSDDALRYIEQHDFAVKWAKSSRALIAQRFTAQLGATCEAVLDCCHNSVTPIQTEGKTGWLHRKGAVPADSGACVVPGSRGALSYLVQPVGEQHRNLWSLAHGAGRKWNRKSCKGRIRPNFKARSLTQTALGSAVICDDKELLYEEAPQAYKNIDAVIDDMLSDKLIAVVATFRPLITYKVRKTT